MSDCSQERSASKAQKGQVEPCYKERWFYMDDVTFVESWLKVKFRLGVCCTLEDWF